MGRHRRARSRPRAADGSALRGPRQPARRLRSLGCAGVHARHDGHDSQHGRHRRDRRGAREDDGRRAPGAGRLPPPHPGVRGRGSGHPQGPLRDVAGGGQEGRRAPVRLRTATGRVAPAHRPLQGDDRRGDGRPARPRPVGAPQGGRPGGVRLVEQPTGHHLPRVPRHLARHGHRLHRHGDGVREPRRRQRDRRALLPQPRDRRPHALRRVPSERAGRGRGRRDPNPAADRRAAGELAGGLPGDRGHRPHARGALQGRAGHRVHGRAGQAVHTPDALRQADRPRRGAHRGRFRSGGGADPGTGAGPSRGHRGVRGADAALRGGGKGDGRPGRSSPCRGRRRISGRGIGDRRDRPGSRGRTGRCGPAGAPRAPRDEPPTTCTASSRRRAF